MVGRKAWGDAVSDGGAGKGSMVERFRMAMRMGGRCGSGIGRVVGVKGVALVREVARTGGCVGMSCEYRETSAVVGH
jgi:hypothetical protein